MSPTFRSLSIPNYRIWAAGAIVSNTGTWMQRVAQDWLVLTVLTENSGVAVGITTGLQFAPALLLAPVAGAVADRLDRRRVLMATQTASGLLALVLGLLVVTGTAQLWMVYALAFGLGLVAAIDAPARQAFVSEMVPVEVLPNAVGLNSASFHAGRLIGPGVAGLLIHWLGTGPVFLINAATFGAVLLSLTRMRVADLRRPTRSARGKGAVREGLRYVRGRRDILLILVVVGMVGTFGLNFQLTTALMARLVFDKGAGEYGLLGSIMAIGSLGGALLAARREHPRLRLVLGAAMAFGVFALVASVMPTYTLFAIALVPVGLASLTLMTAANSTVQMTTPPHMRGRVMALYMAVFMGGTPIGSPIIGWVGETFGARWTIALGGIVTLVTALLCVAWLMLARGVHVRYDRHANPHLVVTEDVAPAAPAGREAEARERETARERVAADQTRDSASAA
ncbi:MFS transporter [Kineosporia sp. R_H_3]|uniref:MFS transporter n=1 Tax=Kineosporia sp. R_H_3 TaxID=1961848 RepID=UPI000B4ADA98|nr:MFS transporter [Kineosporia sp. R_H_3]